MAAPAAPGALHAQMHMQRLGPTLVFLQPVADGGRAAGPSLTVELTSGAVGLAEHSVPLAAEAGGAETVFGVIGILRLLGTCALAVITGAEQVATLRGHPVFLVTRTRVLAAASAFKDDARCAAPLNSAPREALPPRACKPIPVPGHAGTSRCCARRWTRRTLGAGSSSRTART